MISITTSNTTCSLLILFIISYVSGESFSPDNERLGVAYEFKVHLDAGKEDCFYQYVRAHSSLYVAFQVFEHFCCK